MTRIEQLVEDIKALENNFGAVDPQLEAVLILIDEYEAGK